MLSTLDQFDRIPRILRLNIAGQPIGWISWPTAVCLYTRELVKWTVGESVLRIRGGYSREDGCRTVVDVNSIIACDGHITRTPKRVPPLTNRALFARDKNRCQYCGHKHPDSNLTRDHILPKSRGGTDHWENVVTACKRCNHFKGNRLLEECGWKLIETPYVPTLAEYLAFTNLNRMLGDQKQFLETQYRSKRQDSELMYASS